MIKKTLFFILSSIYLLSAQSYFIEHNISDLDLTKEGLYDLIQYKNKLNLSSLNTTPGAPDLPLYIYKINLAQNMTVRNFTIKSIKEKSLSGRFYPGPVQPLWRQGISFEEAKPDKALYERERPVIEFLGVKYFNGQAVAHFAVRPVRYEAQSAKLYFIENIEFTINTEMDEQNAATPFLQSDAEQSRQTLAALNAPPQQINASITPRKALQAEQLTSGLIDRYVIITTEAFQEALQPLADWKKRRGVPTIIRTINWIKENFTAGADEAETIRNYLRWTYEKRATKYVLLAGDTEFVPTRMIRTGGATFGTDYYYADLDGNWNADQDDFFGEVVDNLDGYPELYVSRIPSRSPEDIQHFVKKLFKYEKLHTIDPNEDYPANILYMAADLNRANDGRDLIMNNIDPKINPAFSKRLITQQGEIGNSPEVPLQELNSNYGLIFSESHGSYNRIRPGAKGSYIYSYTMDELYNEQPSIWYIASCYTNAISRRAISEVFINAQTGAGGVAYIGNSAWEYPFSGIHLQKEFYELLFNKGHYHLAEAHFLSRYPYLGYLNWEGPSRIIVYSTVVLGDAEMPVWTQKPRSLATTERFYTIGETNFLGVQVSNPNSGEAVPEALVSLYKRGQVYDIRYTDATGAAQFPINKLPADSVWLTVSKHNYIPREKILQHINQNAAKLSLVDFSLQNLAGEEITFGQAGQKAQLYLTVKNISNESIGQSAKIVLRSMTPHLKISGAHTLPLLQPQASTQTGPWPLQISSDFPADTTGLVKAVFKIDNYNIGSGNVTFPIELPQVKTHHISYETQSGDSINTSELYIYLTNLGRGTAPAVEGQLLCANDKVTISGGTQSFGDIAYKETKVNSEPYLIEHEGALESLRFSLTVSDELGHEHIFSINADKPLAPDSISFEPIAGQSVGLNWPASSSADVMGYYIWRAETGDDHFQKISELPIPSAGYYRDETVEANKTYLYTVQSVDSSGNVSAATSDTITAWPSVPFQENFPVNLSTKAIGSERNGVVSYDLDNDGQCEIIASGAWGMLNIYSASGARLAQTDLQKGKLTVPAVGNVMGDEAPEIVVSSFREKEDMNAVSVLDGNGTILHNFDLDYNVPSSAVLKDIDHDGLDEILVLTYGATAPEPPKDSRLFIWTFKDGAFKTFEGWPEEGYMFAGDVICFGQPAVADMNRSGKVSVVVSTRLSKIFLFNPADSAQAVWVRTVSGYSNSPVSLADINRDGSLDIVVAANYKDKLYALDRFGNDLPGWEEGLDIEATDQWGRTSPAIIGNLDEDEYLEVVYQGRQHIFVFNHDGSPAEGWPVPVDNGNSYYVVKENMSPYNSPVLADINMDSRQEIIFVTNYGILHAWDFSGKDLPGFPINTHNDQVLGQSPAIDDIDRDGDLEIMFVDQEGILRIWDAPYSYNTETALGWSQPFANAAHTGELDTTIIRLVNTISFSKPIPQKFHLAQNYPNPFNPETVISWQLPVSARVDLEIFNLLGQKINTLFSGNQKAGDYKISWNGKDNRGRKMASGIYIYRLKVSGRDDKPLLLKSRKMILLK